ncbi:MAG: TRASH domain-containing protein [Nanoarchaeota archaeon]|nr:TRASH domain-containing protein [Nanoarchaeota archaeon]
MGLFSCFRKENTLKCDWCGREIEEAPYTKYIRDKKFNFCSESCKQSFRKSGKGKGIYRRCPTCPMSPKSWD